MSNLCCCSPLLSDLFAADLLRRARLGGGGGEGAGRWYWWCWCWIMTNYEGKLKTPRIVMDDINNRKQQI